MDSTLTTMVMIQNPTTKDVLVQERTLKWPGLSFPGGKIEKGENFYDCAVREIKEETGLDIWDLEYCGTVHWCNTETDARYLVFLYKTMNYKGELIADFPQGKHFWYNIEKLLTIPRERFSNENLSYCHLFFHEKFSEVFICYNGDNIIKIEYK